MGLIYIISGAIKPKKQTVPCSNSVPSRGATYPVGRNYMPTVDALHFVARQLGWLQKRQEYAASLFL